MRKPAFCICENKDADQLRGNREADQRLCFRYITSTIPHFLNPKSQASSHLVWLYSSVCVRPGRKPRRPVFSQRGSFVILVVSYFGFEGATVVLIVPVPGKCLPFTFIPGPVAERL